MRKKCETPPVEGGASRDLLAGWSRELPTRFALQTQFLMAAHRVRPELAALLAMLAFGGCAK